MHRECAWACAAVIAEGVVGIRRMPFTMLLSIQPSWALNQAVAWCPWQSANLRTSIRSSPTVAVVLAPSSVKVTVTVLLGAAAASERTWLDAEARDRCG